MVRKCPSFCSEREKKTTSEGSLQFPNGFFGKLLFQPKFPDFLPNCKHPSFAGVNDLYYRSFSRDVIAFYNLKLKSHQSFYPHQA